MRGNGAFRQPAGGRPEQVESRLAVTSSDPQTGPSSANCFQITPDFGQQRGFPRGWRRSSARAGRTLHRRCSRLRRQAEAAQSSGTASPPAERSPVQELPAGTFTSSSKAVRLVSTGSGVLRWKVSEQPLGPIGDLAWETAPPSVSARSVGGRDGAFGQPHDHCDGQISRTQTDSTLIAGRGGVSLGGCGGSRDSHATEPRWWLCPSRKSRELWPTKRPRMLLQCPATMSARSRSD